MMMTQGTLRYLNALCELSARNALATLKYCTECDRSLPENWLDFCDFADQHGVIQLLDGSWTIVIGCEGFHTIEQLTGQLRDGS